MREVQLYPAKKKRLPDVVRKLRFVGAELVAWVDEDRRASADGSFHALGMYSYTPANGASARLEWDVPGYYDGPASDPVVSPDGRYIVTEFFEEDGNFLHFRDRRAPTANLPNVATAPLAADALFFTPDGAAVLAVRSGAFADDLRDVPRFALAQLTAPPVRSETRRNPLTGSEYTASTYALEWEQVFAPLLWARANTAALSANGRLLAVADLEYVVHIVDLDARTLVVSYPAEGWAHRDRGTQRLGFDPAAEWLVRLGGGKLFARSLTGGKAWRTKPALGVVSDFAFHPSGAFLCAVFADGQARYFDLRTGAVVRAFKWGRKPLHSVCFAPDGLTCVAGGESGRLVLWDVDV